MTLYSPQVKSSSFPNRNRGDSLYFAVAKLARFTVLPLRAGLISLRQHSVYCLVNGVWQVFFLLLRRRKNKFCLLLHTRKISYLLRKINYSTEFMAFLEEKTLGFSGMSEGKKCWKVVFLIGHYLNTPEDLVNQTIY